MSVRATERLIGDVVVVTGLSNSPKMVVQAVNIDAKQVTAVWFADDHSGQQGIFPAAGIDRLEVPAPSAKSSGSGAKGKKPAAKGKK
ncbi:hypothetical protein [Treponema primitia]|uniref:hypothetical protein n=1 Tax=Treponema primitia TaxID=88058 RepID=UPI0002555719|nr:hypothetical protein [Treponema primitia]